MHAATVDKSDIATRIDALDWNRRLWSTLATACSEPSNTMPQALRAQIISLDLFISRHSSAVMRGEDDFETLIDINRMIMQGLAGPAQAA
jgi:flagellar protein FlaF